MVSYRLTGAAQVRFHKCALRSSAASQVVNYPALVGPKTPQPPAAATPVTLMSQRSHALFRAAAPPSLSLADVVDF